MATIGDGYKCGSCGSWVPYNTSHACAQPMGYTCAACHQWVPFNYSHACPALMTPNVWPVPVPPPETTSTQVVHEGCAYSAVLLHVESGFWLCTKCGASGHFGGPTDG